MQHPNLFFSKCILQNATLTGKQMNLKSKKPENTTWKFYSVPRGHVFILFLACEVYAWTIKIGHRVRDLPNELVCTHNQYSLQLCRYRHLRATLMFSATCFMLAGRHGWLYMFTYTTCLLRCLQKAKFTDIYSRGTGLNNLESLRLYQVYPLGALEVPVLQLKTSLRATSIFNMPSAAALCRTPTRNTPHLFIS